MFNPKGATVIELMIVLVIISILSSIAMPMYADYTKKARTAEVPLNLKKIVEGQIAFVENPENGGRYATSLATIGWSTSGDSLDTPDVVEGTYYNYYTANNPSCVLGTPLIGLAVASARVSLVEWPEMCLDSQMVMWRQ